MANSRARACPIPPSVQPVMNTTGPDGVWEGGINEEERSGETVVVSLVAINGEEISGH